MSGSSLLPVDSVLESAGRAPGRIIGESRNGRPIYGHRFGSGPLRVSLIGGCHADEPVGPETLELLCAFLADLPDEQPLLRDVSWRIVPHVNPDGRALNERWTARRVATRDHLGRPDYGFDLATFLGHVVRELPGDDIEFGFPAGSSDGGARPENRAVAAFLAADGPLHLHGSFHGMALAPGPWFLIEPSWAERTRLMRATIRARVDEMRYEVYDPDRKGEKGFHRIDKGFSTRPDSREMRRFFELRGEPEMAQRFRPSSMEFVRALGGNPLTFVSEMPLFLTLLHSEQETLDSAGLRALRHRLDAAAAQSANVDDLARTQKISPMPIRDQQRLQLTLLRASLEVIRSP